MLLLICFDFIILLFLFYISTPLLINFFLGSEQLRNKSKVVLYWTWTILEFPACLKSINKPAHAPISNKHCVVELMHLCEKLLEFVWYICFLLEWLEKLSEVFVVTDNLRSALDRMTIVWIVLFCLSGSGSCRKKLPDKPEFNRGSCSLFLIDYVYFIYLLSPVTACCK